MRMLLVEDDPMISRSLLRVLRDDGYSIDLAQDGHAALHALKNPDAGYALIILDWAVPKLSGIELLEWMRERRMGVPVLMVTARDAVADRVRGLDSGADDYLIKPFSLEELRARIRTLLRRSNARPEAYLGCDWLCLDMATHTARYHDREIELTAREFSLLRALLQTPGETLSRSQLESRIYGWGEEVSSNAVEFLIHSLRRKLTQDVIENVRGAGWRIPIPDRAS